MDDHKEHGDDGGDDDDGDDDDGDDDDDNDDASERCCRAGRCPTRRGQG